MIIIKKSYISNLIENRSKICSRMIATLSEQIEDLILIRLAMSDSDCPNLDKNQTEICVD